MTRPTAYNRDEVLKAALEVFWQNGYEASSIQKLLEAMGLNRGSLYAGFTDKETLFREVMALYAADISELIEATLVAEQQPLIAIRRFFTGAFLEQEQSSLARGCLLFNTISELAFTEPSLVHQASRYMNGVKQKLTARLQQAAELGLLNPSKSPAEFAEFLFALIAGLRIQCKLGAKRELLQSIIDTGLGALEKPGAGTGNQ